MARILVVDDNSASREFLRTRLSEGGHQLIEAADGSEGLAMVRSSKPDLVISDILMPQMDGFQFVAHVRHEDAIAHTPVLFWSANYTDPKSEALARSCGVNRILAKSAPPAEMARAIDEALTSRPSPQSPPLPLRFHRDHVQLVTDKLSQKVLENEQLSHRSEAAEQFVDHVSYEFVTPLTVIEWCCSAIRDGFGGAVTQQQIEYLNSALDSTRDLTWMIGLLEDSNKLLAGTLRADRQACEVTSILTDVALTLQAKSAARNVRLVEHAEPDLPRVFADARLVTRVLLTLAARAMKAAFLVKLSAVRTGDGDVEVAVTDVAAAPSPESLKLTTAYLSHVGDGHEPASRSIPLDLRIARELAALNLSTISTQSRPSGGSTFSLTLPTTDWRQILSRFLRFAPAGNRDSQWSALLRATPEGWSGGGDELRSLVINSSSPRDLVIGCPDGSQLVLGISNDAAQWARRLSENCASRAPISQRSGGGDLQVEMLGSWKHPAEQEWARRVVLAHLQ